MPNKKICLINGSRADENLIRKQGFDLIHFPSFRDGYASLIEQKNIVNYPIVLIADGGTAAAADFCETALESAKRGRYGVVGIYVSNLMEEMGLTPTYEIHIWNNSKEKLCTKLIHAPGRLEHALYFANTTYDNITKKPYEFSFVPAKEEETATA